MTLKNFCGDFFAVNNISFVKQTIENCHILVFKGPFHFSRENSVQSLSGGIGAEGDEDQDARYMTRAHYSRNYPPSPLSRITSSSQTLRGVHTSQGIARSERRRSSQRGSRGMEVDSELRRSSGSRMASMG